MSKKCVDCHRIEPPTWHGRYCGSCYKARYYRIHLDKERESRNISSKKYYSTPLGRYKFSQRRAKDRKLTFTLDFSEYAALISTPCFYCKGQLNSMGVGLDRVNSQYGYVSENVVPCCGNCNKMKNDILTSQEMSFLMEKLKEFRDVKNSNKL